MTDEYYYLIAKSDKDNKNLWLPLYMHLKDTAEVIKRLLNIMPLSIMNASGISEEDFHKISIFLASVHDIGKATSYFQSIITKENSEKISFLNSVGFAINKEYKNFGKTPHAYAGQWILQSELAPFEIDSRITDIIGAHHGKPIETGMYCDDLLEIYPENFYGNKKNKSIWKNSWKKIVNNALKYSGYEDIEDLPILSVEAQIILSGILIEADWISSNTSYFPLIDDDIFNASDLDSLYPKRVNDGWEKLKFPPSWESNTSSMDESTFNKIFGFMPNTIQKRFIEIVENCKNPGIFIIESPMGCGKTEVALAASEIIANHENEGGIFFGLPTQATSNGIFKRLIPWAEKVSHGTAVSVKLAHSAAELNEDYNKFLIKGKSSIDEDEPDGVQVHSWFQGNKRALLADFVVGTVDNFLLATLKQKHFMLRHLGLAGKVIIIDECHAYDTYMMSYLERSIKWMAAYKIPVILLSATLPYQKRKELINSYVFTYARLHKNKKQPEYKIEDWDKTNAYPLITYTDGNVVNQEKILYTSQDKKVAINKVNNIQNIIDILKDKLSDGGAACIIVNTVKSSQEIYDIIKDKMPEYRILLYHSGFIATDRISKEQSLLSAIGKESKSNDRDKFILIGTQVLEQSLDYDADIMITQLCPMDLLLQRIGRLHRHNRIRPEKCKKSECIIFEYEDKAYDSGTKTVYGDYLLMKTNCLLKDCINIPNDISPLVQKVYDIDNDLNLTSEEYFSAKEQFIKLQEEEKQKSEHYLLSRPENIYPPNIENIIKNENTNSEKNSERSVRDSEGSVEVLALTIGTDGYIYTFDKKNKFNRNTVPSYDDSLIILRQRLKLSSFFSKKWNISQTIDILEKDNINKLPLWQDNPMLKDELIMLFDANSSYEMCYSNGENKNIYILHYDQEKGLEFKKGDDIDGEEI